MNDPRLALGRTSDSRASSAHPRASVDLPGHLRVPGAVEFREVLDEARSRRGCPPPSGRSSSRTSPSPQEAVRCPNNSPAREFVQDPVSSAGPHGDEGGQVGTGDSYPSDLEDRQRFPSRSGAEARTSRRDSDSSSDTDESESDVGGEDTPSRGGSTEEAENQPGTVPLCELAGLDLSIKAGGAGGGTGREGTARTGSGGASAGGKDGVAEGGTRAGTTVAQSASEMQASVHPVDSATQPESVTAGQGSPLALPVPASPSDVPIGSATPWTASTAGVNPTPVSGAAALPADIRWEAVNSVEQVPEVVCQWLSTRVFATRAAGGHALTLVTTMDGANRLRVTLETTGGQARARAQLECGDADRLGSRWSELQQMLAQQGIELAPLEVLPSTSETETTGGLSSGSGRGDARHRQLFDSSAATETVPDKADLRIRGGEQTNLTADPGASTPPGRLETWA